MNELLHLKVPNPGKVFGAVRRYFRRGRVFYLGSRVNQRYVNGVLEFIGEDDGEDVLQGVCEDGEDWDFALEALEQAE